MFVLEMPCPSVLAEEDEAGTLEVLLVIVRKIDALIVVTVCEGPKGLRALAVLAAVAVEVGFKGELDEGIRDVISVVGRLLALVLL